MVARTQAIHFRDRRGREPVNEFVDDLDPKPAAKIDDFIEEHLNGKDPSSPPPEHPISSQIEGELRELRVRFGKTRYRVLFQRSENLIVLLHAFEKNTRFEEDGRFQAADECVAAGATQGSRLRRTLSDGASVSHPSLTTLFI